MISLEVRLTRGRVAFIDEQDADLVSGHSWTASSRGGLWYAQTRTGGLLVEMHRLITGAGPGEEVDHWDGDGLNNRRSNLRLTTHALNLANQRPQVGRSSRFKGVSWARDKGRWNAYIKVRGHRSHLGYFDDEREAAMAYNSAALGTWGEYARLNQVDHVDC